MNIKICGIQTIDEVNILNKHKPDYAGFVFAKSKRRVNPETAKSLIEELDESIKSCGVFKDQSLEDIKEITNYCKLDVVQIHEDLNDIKIKWLRDNILKDIEIILAMEMKEGIELNTPLVDYYLMDAKNPGSGECFDWNLISLYKRSLKRLIIAGGLDPVNVKDLIAKYKPYCVDVSSGVQGASGFKDEELVKQFILNVRSEI